MAKAWHWLVDKAVSIAQVSWSVIDSAMQRVGEYMAKAWHWLVDKVVGILVGLLSVLFVLFLAVMFCEGAESYISELLDLKKKKHEVLKFLGIGMGGILLALQALASHKRAKAMEDAANAQAEATKEQAKANRTTEQGLRQERLKNAIEHLGHRSDSVRLGGAYELIHLAEDTEELRETTLNILCAHIRRTTGEDNYQKEYRRKPSEEVQSLLTLLFAQKYEIFQGLRARLQGSYLPGADLAEARLQSALLTNTWLRGANLEYACLQWAEFQKSDLKGANCTGALLQGAKLWGTHLQGAEMGGAHLQQAELRKAELQGVSSSTTYISFEEQIRYRINQKTDLTKTIFRGGMNKKCLDALFDNLFDENPQVRKKDRQRFEQWHIDQPTSHEPPKNSGAITGFYTAEEAEQWITEYNEAMSEALQAAAD